MLPIKPVTLQISRAHRSLAGSNQLRGKASNFPSIIALSSFRYVARECFVDDV